MERFDAPLGYMNKNIKGVFVKYKDVKDLEEENKNLRGHLEWQKTQVKILMEERRNEEEEFDIVQFIGKGEVVTAEEIEERKKKEQD